MCFPKRATPSKPGCAKGPTENTARKQIMKNELRHMGPASRAAPAVHQARAKPPRFQEHRSLNPSSSTSSGRQSGFSRESASSGSLAGVRQLVSDGAVVYRHKELSRATDHFSSSMNIPGSKSVFRASLMGVEVAVTRKKHEGQGMDFLAELKLLCSVHHTNIVKLLGGCFVKGDCVYLVHELAEGANLRHALRSPHNPGFCLLASLASRLQVGLDVAKALEYLHEYAYPTFVHRFVQSSNVIIDNDLRAKIAKFGVSKLIGDTVSQTPTPDPSSRSSGEHSIFSGEIQPSTGAGGSGRSSPLAIARPRSGRIIGTKGYMPPEYCSSGIVSVKYDVFSFGVILLELLSGQEPLVYVPDKDQNSVTVNSVTDAISYIMEDSNDSRTRLRKWMDPLLRDQYSLDHAYQAAALAKSCVDPDPTIRPHMRDVAVKLSKLLTATTVWETNLASAKNAMSGPVEAR